jgi:hypothetical protein
MGRAQLWLFQLMMKDYDPIEYVIEPMMTFAKNEQSKYWGPRMKRHGGS